MTENQMAFIARLSREYPSKPVHQIAEDSKRLFALGRKIQRLAENECNGVPKGRYPNGSIEMRWDEEDDKKAEKIYDAVQAHIVEMGYKTSRCGGDPRGCCLQLKLPSGFVDGWGQEGFLVPYSG